jgi:hypothetical protein
LKNSLLADWEVKADPKIETGNQRAILAATLDQSSSVHCAKIVIKITQKDWNR